MIRTRPTYTIISLYTGAGGLDLGMEAAGFRTRVAVEWDSDAAETLRHNRSWPVIQGDIHSEAASSSNILRLGQLASGEADLLLGGPPCQPFSKSGYWAAGDTRRLDDPRATSLDAYFRVLRDTQPRAFLLENVPGFAFNGKSEGLELVERTIEAINDEIGTSYSVSHAILNAVEHGVPQERHRLFVVGARDGTHFEFPAPTYTAADPERSSEAAISATYTLQPALTAWDAIGDLEDDEDPSLRMSGKWAELLPSIPEGSNYLYHTDRGMGAPLFGWRRRYWSFLLKLAKNRPSWTLTASPGPAIGPLHWRNRRLSAHEMLRLQTFPEGYQVIGNRRSVQRQIGNAVPAALAERLGIEIRRQLLSDRTSISSHPTLAPGRRGDAPPPEPVADVPARYLHLAAVHAAHPGTGLGPGAVRRSRGE